MGNLIFSGSYTLATNNQISMPTEHSTYPKINVMDLFHLKRCTRSSNTATGSLIQFDFSSAATIEGIVLNDVNFDTVEIKGNNTDSWGSPSFESSELGVYNDEVVNRYKVYIPLTNFFYRYLQVSLPTGVAEVGSSLGVWSIGSIMLITDAITLSRNMSYGYSKTSSLPFEDILLGNGGIERVKLGDNLLANIQIPFRIRRETEEAELWTLNRVDMSVPICIFVNLDNTSGVYICVRDNSYTSKLVQHNQVKGNTLKFKELV